MAIGSELPDDLRDPWFASRDRPVDAQALLHFCMPQQVAFDPSTANVNFTMFETTRIPRFWVRLARRMAMTIVPTPFVRRTWLSSGVAEDRVRVCPLGVDVDAFRPGIDPLAISDDQGRPIARYRTRFLNVSAISPRKNLLGLLRAWIAATSPDDDAVLVIKANTDYPAWNRQFEQQLAQLDYRGKRLCEAAPVRMLVDRYSDKEMPHLFASATHYISLSFAEGWDLPMMEAAATDLTLIAPDHSAYHDYLDASTARLIPCRPIPADYGFPGILGPLARIGLRGSHWWRPDEEAAAAYIRRAIDGQDEQFASPRQQVACRYTWTNATKRLIAILDEVIDS